MKFQWNWTTGFEGLGFSYLDLINLNNCSFMAAPFVLAYLILLDDILQYDLILVDVPYNHIHSY